MNFKKAVAAAGVAKKLHTESRKPENRARIREAIGKVRSRSKRG